MSQDEDKPVKMADKPMADTSAEEKGQVSDVFAENLAWSQQLGELKTSLRCTFACLGVATMAILVGYDMMLIGSIIANNEFVENFGVYHEALGEWSLPADRQLAWTICQYLSAILGAVLVGLMSDRLGRRIAVYSTVR